MSKKSGEYPFTRGIYEKMYQKKLWTMRQYAGFTSAEESNKRYRYLIEEGVTGLSVAFDLPTQIGYDSDHPMASGEVGKVGVPISSANDMTILFNDISLDQVSTSMTINSTAATLLSFYVVVAEKNGIPLNKLKGTIQNDILKEYTVRGTYIYPPESSMRLITDTFAFCESHLPSWNPISISGYHIREAGSTAAQEIGFTFANAIEYVQLAIDQGQDPNLFGKRLSFFFNSHNGFLEEVAKFRAARKIWAKIMKERFKVKDEKAMHCRFHVQTGGSTLTAQQVENNIVRTTIQALAAVLGGAQSLHTNAFDEALALPTNHSAKIALRTQQIIAYESEIVKYIDPLGNSNQIEALTEEICEKADKLIKDIDDLGGAIKAIEQGWIQKEISKSAYSYQQSIDKKEQIIVGLNKFKENDDVKIDLQNIDNEIIKEGKKLIYLFFQIILYYLSLLYLYKKLLLFYDGKNISILIIAFLALDPNIIQWHGTFWTESIFISMQVFLIGMVIHKNKTNFFCLFLGLFLFAFLIVEPILLLLFLGCYIFVAI